MKLVKIIICLNYFIQFRNRIAEQSDRPTRCSSFFLKPAFHLFFFPCYKSLLSPPQDCVIDDRRSGFGAEKQMSSLRAPLSNLMPAPLNLAPDENDVPPSPRMESASKEENRV